MDVCGSSSELLVAEMFLPGLQQLSKYLSAKSKVCLAPSPKSWGGGGGVGKGGLDHPLFPESLPLH